jgi:hypothetical protein
MPPDEPNYEERLEELPEDNQTPFNPAAPSRDDSLPPDDDAQPGGLNRSGFDDTHPNTDTDVQREEIYDAGEATASSGADEPHDDPTVVGYNPPDKPDNPG